MNRSEIDTQLRGIFSDLFDASPGEISYATNPDMIEAWDSLAHVNLINAIEHRFNLLILPEDQIDMLSFELIGDILSDMLTMD